MLLLALVAVVGLAKVESPAIEDAVESAGLPHSMVGIVIALLVLLPEMLAASERLGQPGPDQSQPRARFGDGKYRAHDPRNRRRVDLAGGPLLLGLGPTQLVLLALTVVVSVLTVVAGRATLLRAECT